MTAARAAFENDHPKKPSEKYTTIWYDQWRIINGKADEHWDTADIDAE